MTRTNPVYVYLELRMGGYVIPENGLKYNRVKIKIEHKLKLLFHNKEILRGTGSTQSPEESARRLCCSRIILCWLQFSLVRWTSFACSDWTLQLFLF